MGEWRKSSYSQGSGDCVEVREGDPIAEVRDTKDPDRRSLAFAVVEWSRFIRAVQADAFGV